MRPTLSVAINAHSEGRLLRPTLRSVAAAIATVSEATECELLIVLDKATPETLEEARKWVESDRIDAPVRLVEVEFGDAGASRNAAAQNARGLYLAFIDGDDLVSSNYLADGLHLLLESDERVILHPGTVVSFGARSTIWKILPTDTVDAFQLIRDNLWPSSSISLRDTYLEVPYRSTSPERGFGPEDWLWNIETSIAGFAHRPVPGTMFFYRVRESGGVNNRHLRSILPGFDIDGLVRAMPRQETTAIVTKSTQRRSRDRLKRLLRFGYKTALPLIRLLLGFLTQGQKERLYAWAKDVYVNRGRRAKRRPVVPQEIVSALKEACEIEPALSWTANGFAHLSEWHPHVDEYSPLLFSLVKQLRGTRALVAVPWVGIGGADLVSLNYARALAEDDRFAGNVTILATHIPSRTLRHLIPPGVTFVQVPESFRELTPNQQRRLLAHALLFVRPELILSINCFDVTNSLQLYGRQLGATSRIYLSLFAFDRIGDGYPTNPITDDGQREYLDDIAGILTDNSVTAGIVSEMLALGEDQVRVHHQPALDPIPGFRPGTRAFNNRFFSEKNPFTVIWPHRLDKEKRPDSLIKISHMLQEEGLPVEIHVHGQQVLSSDGKTLMASLAEANLKYLGPYTGGLAALPTENYHALLLTSESEGLPLVLVQSMLLGLPVIATAVGGVTDIIKDGETGLLVSNPDDTAGFVEAIRHLMSSLEDRRSIIHSAYDFAASQHGWSTFTKLVDTLA